MILSIRHSLAILAISLFSGPLAFSQSTSEELAADFFQALQEENVEALEALLPSKADMATIIKVSDFPEELKEADLVTMDEEYPALSEELADQVETSYAKLMGNFEQLKVDPEALKIAEIEAEETRYRGIDIGALTIHWTADGMSGTLEIPHVMKCGDHWRMKNGEFTLLRARPNAEETD